MTTSARTDQSELLHTLPEEISQSPYRVLGVAVTATTGEIRDAADVLLQCLKINRPINRPDYLAFFHAPVLTQEDIEQARHSLGSPRRPIHTFFWFSFHYQQAESVRSQLSQGNLEAALMSAQSAVDESVGDEYQDAIHDYGLLLFIDAQLQTDQETACSHYSQSIGILQASSRTQLQRAEDQQSVLQVLVATITKRMQVALDHQEYAAACAYLSVLDDWLRDAPEDQQALATRPFRLLVEQITLRASTLRSELAKRDSSLSHEELDAYALRFDEQALTPAHALIKHYHGAPLDLRPACDELIDCGDLIARRFYEYFSDVIAVDRIVSKLTTLPASKAKINALEKNAGPILRRAKLERARQLMRDGQWKIAIQAFQQALSHCTDATLRQLIEDDIRRCRQAIEAQQTPEIDNTSIWTGYVGTQIRRCLRNLVVVSVLLIVAAIIIGCCTSDDLRAYRPIHSISAIKCMVLLLWLLAINNIWAAIRQYGNLALHPISRSLAQYGPLEWVIQSIDGEQCEELNPLGKFLPSSYKCPYQFSKLWVLRPTFFGLVVIRSIDVIRAYLVSTRHTRNGVYQYTDYQVVLCLRNRKKISIPYGTIEDFSHEALNMLHKRYPWIIMGYNDEIERIWSQQPNEVIAAADERRDEVMPYIVNAYPVVPTGQNPSLIAPRGTRITLLDSIQQYIIPAITILGCLLCAFSLFGYDSEQSTSESTPQYSSAPSYTTSVPNSMPYSSSTDTAPPSTAGQSSPPATPERETTKLHAAIKDADATLSTWKIQIAMKKATLESLDAQIASYKSHIHEMKAADSRGEYVDTQQYNSLVDEHNRLVRQYNATRAAHNALVDKFNKLVKARNDKLDRLKQLEGGY